MKVQALLGIVLLAVAGCTDVSSSTASGQSSMRPAQGASDGSRTGSPAGSALGRAPTSGPTPASGQASAVPAPGSVRKLDTANAKLAQAGREYVDVADPPTTGPRGEIHVKDLIDDGATVVSTQPRATSDDGGLRLYQSTVGTLRGTTFTPFPQPEAGPARSAVYLDSAGRYTAWTETTSTSLDEFDWKVFLQDANTGKTRKLGDSRDIAPVRPVSARGESDPTVGEREVYWAATAPRNNKEGFDDLILGAPLDRPERMRTVVVGGYYPAADGADLLYVSSTHLDRNEAYAGRPATKGTDRYEIQRLRNGQTTTLASGTLTGDQSISGLTAHHGTVAYTLSRNPTATTSTLVLLEPDGKRTNIRMHHNGGSSVQLTDRFLAWGSGSSNGDAGQYLLDRPSGQLYKLGEAKGLSLMYSSPSGEFLGWTVPPASPNRQFLVQLVRWTGRQ